MITLYCRIDNECRCDTYDNCSIRTEKGGKRSYMIQRFAYFTQSGTILTVNRLCYVRKCPFYSLEQPLKKRILKELCSSVVSGSTSIFPAYVWSFDPFLSHAGPWPIPSLCKTPSDKSPQGRQTSPGPGALDGYYRISQRPLTSNYYTFLFLKFFSPPTTGSFSLMIFSFSGPSWSFLS